MPHTIMLVPTGSGVGLTTAALGLLHALDSQGIRVGFYQPVAQARLDTKFTSPAAIYFAKHVQIQPASPITQAEVEHLLGTDKQNELLEKIIANYEQYAQHADVILVQGLFTSPQHPYAAWLNQEIVKALGAEVIFITAPGNRTPQQLAEQLHIIAHSYDGLSNRKLLGCIVNKINAPVDEQGHSRLDLVEELTRPTPSIPYSLLQETYRSLEVGHFKLVGCIPWHTELIAPRVKDIADFLQASLLATGEMNERRVARMTLCARSAANVIPALKPNTLIITAGDRIDVILAAFMAATAGIKIAGLLLTGNYPLPDTIIELGKKAIATGLPILSVPSDSLRTVIRLQNLSLEVPADDVERLEHIAEFVAQYIATDWIKSFLRTTYERHLSPAAFRYRLLEKARKANKTIVLPEGEEPRIIQAAMRCKERGIANCILLGNPETVAQIAKNHGIHLASDLLILPPEQISDKYIEPMVQLRQHKGMTPLIAQAQLKDPIVVGTMMVACGEADGLVAGACTTTANTIRPALQLIKTKPHVKLVSSLFFMCLPNQVLVYADCAINPDPSAEELADIAIQSADSALTFGITPRIAMISYSTGYSGQGVDVEKVRKATQLVKGQRPDLLIDGPLQYDAAFSEEVAKKKAPDSPVAGKATVFIFPDLNTGNTTYKAVQRSANVICIGPMLQGLRKPVNDLSRGATIEDILYTIAITAVQAANT